MSTQSVAIVTAAGGGIGAACARALAARGHDLVLMSRGSSAATVAEALGATSVQGSVTETADLERLVATAMETHGRIDTVVNNTGHAAGSSSPTGRSFDADADGHLLDIDDDAWHGAFDIYMLNVVRMARLVTPIMQAQGGGAIVNISAFAVRDACQFFPMSSTIRAATRGFTKLYADRYARDGIRMNDLAPGYLDNHSWSDELLHSIPMARAGAVDEIGETAAFLASAEAGYITGQVIVADGGLNRAL